MYILFAKAVSAFDIVSFVLALAALLMMFFTKKLAEKLTKDGGNKEKVYFGIKLIAFAVALLAVAFLVFAPRG